MIGAVCAEATAENEANIPMTGYSFLRETQTIAAPPCVIQNAIATLPNY